jgi:hypothetical protein
MSMDDGVRRGVLELRGARADGLFWAVAVFSFFVNL